MEIKTNQTMLIPDVDISTSGQAETGYYTKIDSSVISFSDWVDLCMKPDSPVDMTYYEFEFDIPEEVKAKYIESGAHNNIRKKKKYIITNRRVIHIYNTDPFYHHSGRRHIPTTPEEIEATLKNPDIAEVANRNNRVLKNNTLSNDAQTILRFDLPGKYLRIQTSYINESYLILDFDSVLTSNSEMLNKEGMNFLYEDAYYLKPLQEKYLLVEKLLFTYAPSVVALDNTIDGKTTKSLQLDEEQVPIIRKHLDFLTEELSCDYLLEGNELTLKIK